MKENKMNDIKIISLPEGENKFSIAEEADHLEQIVHALREGIPIVIAVPFSPSSSCCYYDRRGGSPLEAHYFKSLSSKSGEISPRYEIKHALKGSRTKLFVTECCDGHNAFKLKDEFGEPLIVVQPKVVLYRGNELVQARLLAAEAPQQVYATLSGAISIEQDKTALDQVWKRFR